MDEEDREQAGLTMLMEESWVGGESMQGETHLKSRLKLTKEIQFSNWLLGGFVFGFIIFSLLLFF